MLRAGRAGRQPVAPVDESPRRAPTRDSDRPEPEADAEVEPVAERRAGERWPRAGGGGRAGERNRAWREPETEAVPEPEAEAKPKPAAPARRNGRPSVPSWDDIMFGARPGGRS